MGSCFKLVWYGVVGMVLIACNPSGDQLVRKEAESGSTGAGAASSPSFQLEANRLLDATTLQILKKYGKTIRSSADLYGMDWRLVLAVMKCESSFDPNARSSRGAWGFMQIMPATGVEVGRAIDRDVLARPSDNIVGGVYYLQKLYGMFEGADPTERLKLTLAAYNAGIGRVYDAQDIAAYLREDPHRWESIRDALPLLSKRYYTLHASVWPEGQPRSGWFGGYGETVTYVGRVMRYYDEYRLTLN